MTAVAHVRVWGPLDAREPLRREIIALARYVDSDRAPLLVQLDQIAENADWEIVRPLTLLRLWAAARTAGDRLTVLLADVVAAGMSLTRHNETSGHDECHPSNLSNRDRTDWCDTRVHLRLHDATTDVMQLIASEIGDGHLAELDRCGSCDGKGEIVVGRDEWGNYLTAQCADCDGQG